MPKLTKLSPTALPSYHPSVCRPPVFYITPSCPTVLKLYGLTAVLFHRPTVQTSYGRIPSILQFLCPFIRPTIHPSIRPPGRLPVCPTSECGRYLIREEICCHLANKIVAFHYVTRCRKRDSVYHLPSVDCGVISFSATQGPGTLNK